MRLLLELEPQAEYEYQKQYHHNLRGIFYNCLRETQYEIMHDDSQSHPFTFSNIYPWEPVFSPKSRKNLIVASYDDAILGEIAEELQSNKYLEVGEMKFEIVDVSPVQTDVGRPGTSGIIRSPTGILVYPDFFDDDEEDGSYTHWNTDLPLESFKNPLQKNAEWKFEKYTARSINESPPDCELFERYDFKKEFALPVKVTKDYEKTFILSDWELHYYVKSQKHRRWLNTLLNVGIGWRNQSGFGFLNILQDC